MTDDVRAALDAVGAGARASTLESDQLEFKTVGRSVPDTLVDLAEASACMANAKGGSVVVGVADDASGPAAFVGAGDLDAVRTQRRIYELTEPRLVVSIEPLRYGGAELLEITVPRSPDVHQVRGRATERIGASCVPMPAVRIAAVVADRHGHDWSAEDSGVGLDRVSARAVEEARALLAVVREPERRRWARLPVPDLLRRLGVVTPGDTLSNGGALMFTSTRAGALISYTHRRTRSGELTVNERLTGPGLTVVLRCLELIDSRTDRTPINVASGQQLFIADLPEAAVREAVVNACMHRDYHAGAPVQVEHSPTRIAVTSPGDFVPGVTAENLLTVNSRSRNAALTALMRRLGLAEDAGVGVDRMYAEMVGVGHHPPTFSSSRDYVTATLLGGAPNTSVTRFVTTLPEQWRTNPDPLLVLLTLLGQRTVTAAAIAPLLQKGLDESEVILQLLAGSDGFIERTRGSATHRLGVYRLRAEAIATLGTAVAYRRRGEDDTDRKVVEIVRETGQINGRMVRTLLDVDTPTASRILADLVDRQVLVKTSEAQRGPSVTYGKGPKFPSRTTKLRNATTKREGDA